MAGVSQNYFILSQKFIVKITVVLKAIWTLPFIIITVDIRCQNHAAYNPEASKLPLFVYNHAGVSNRE